MTEILLLEDDPILGRGVSVMLELEGYKVHWARDLRTARQLNKTMKLGLAILDLGLPDGSGLEFLKEIRDGGSRLPVVILTAKTDEDSVVQGLQLGANDYVRKPFGNREFIARLKAAMREPQQREHQLRYGDLLLIIDNRQLFFGETQIDLNRREFDILTYLIEHADSVVTRDSLITSIDKDGEIFDRTVDSHVSHIRARLKQGGADSIKISSVYGVGYRLEKK